MPHKHPSSHAKAPPAAVPPAQIVHLEPGAQVVINGALVCAREACALEIGAGAFVLAGRALFGDDNAVHNPCDELYFSLLDCVADAERFYADRFRLFALLGEVAAQEGLIERHREGPRCAAALMAGDVETAVESAARMASSGMETARRHTATLGSRVERRRTAHRRI